MRYWLHLRYSKQRHRPGGSGVPSDCQMQEFSFDYTMDFRWRAPDATQGN